MSIEVDVRNLAKWLNEEQIAPIDRKALARVLAHLQNQEQPAKKVAALKTLESLGYTYHGGELWKPPIGKPPRFQAVNVSMVSMQTSGKCTCNRFPLTDEQIWDAYMKAPVDINCHIYELHKFARAIEAAHGITGKGSEA